MSAWHAIKSSISISSKIDNLMYNFFQSGPNWPQFNFFSVRISFSLTWPVYISRQHSNFSHSVKNWKVKQLPTNLSVDWVEFNKNFGNLLFNFKVRFTIFFKFDISVLSKWSRKAKFEKKTPISSGGCSYLPRYYWCNSNPRIFFLQDRTFSLCSFWFYKKFRIYSVSLPPPSPPPPPA